MTVVNQRGRYGRYINNALTLSDFFVVNMIYALVLLLNPEVWHGSVRLVGVLVNIAYLPAAWFLREIRNVRTIHMDHVLLNALKAVVVHALFFFSLLFFLGIDNASWHPYVELYAGCFVALPVWWVISRMFLKKLRRHGRNFSRVAIIGTSATARRLYEEMKSDAGFGYRVLGFIDYRLDADFPWPELYAGNFDDMAAWIKEKRIDQIFYALSGEDFEALHRTMTVSDTEMIQFYFVPQMSRHVTRAFQMHSIGAVPVMTVRNNPLSSIVNRGIKRTFDVVFSSLFLAVSPLIFIPVAIAIKLSSPGPVFFRQQRTGYKGQPFMCWKFRTMRVNADADSRQASKNDPRKTRVGDFLRRTSIDELPQFINVFLGEMSVVGPRPHMLAHTEQYSKLIDKYMVRHLIKPGITGWAQVNGYRGQTEQLWQMERRVEFDVWYIEHWSFLSDLKIVVRTVVNAFHGEENAF